MAIHGRCRSDHIVVRGYRHRGSATVFDRDHGFKEVAVGKSPILGHHQAIQESLLRMDSCPGLAKIKKTITGQGTNSQGQRWQRSKPI